MADFKTELPYNNVLELIHKPYINVNTDVCILAYDQHVIVISISRAVDNYLRNNEAFEEIQFFSDNSNILKITRGKRPKKIAGNSGLC